MLADPWTKKYTTYNAKIASNPVSRLLPTSVKLFHRSSVCRRFIRVHWRWPVWFGYLIDVRCPECMTIFSCSSENQPNYLSSKNEAYLKTFNFVSDGSLVAENMPFNFIYPAESDRPRRNCCCHACRFSSWRTRRHSISRQARKEENHYLGWNDLGHRFHSTVRFHSTSLITISPCR